ncbi:helicase domino isoform X1 [Brachionus plicatilis]|uniref:Helicase domino isoform X1 n=1 Tax=Brachionus plicatilis TaxID=10195 RepID=A0A3M7SA88_BRAPC|nr:helicase domino isoform X1 [Brachionus plicatilis]
MSSDVQQCEPVREAPSPQKRKSPDRQHPDTDEPEPKKTSTHLFAKLHRSIIASQYSHLSKLSSQIELALLEKYFLDNRLVYSDYPKWLEAHSKKPRNKILRDYLISNFSPTELTTLSDKCAAQLGLKLAASSPGASASGAEQFKSIAECAKHEAQVLQRISELRKHGLWSIKRLPKLVEPARAKAHWDYVLDEMVWMSTDFVQERKWKVNTCRKISAAVHKHFKEREARCEAAERDQHKRVRKQAGLVAREIEQFWKQVAKLIEYKQRAISEQKRKIQMDQHLNFIVDQTEKYSSWLVEGLNQTKERSDEHEEDESTIESDEDRPVDDELARLRQESQMDLNVLLKDYNLDESYFCQNFGRDKMEESSESGENEDEAIVSDDMSEEEDDEETIEQDEQMDSEYDAKQELDQLKADFDLPIEQLLVVEKIKNSLIDFWEKGYKILDFFLKINSKSIVKFHTKLNSSLIDFWE